MKYVVLIHSDPQPWGHPTGRFVPAFQALSAAERAEMDADFDRLLAELQANGELLAGAALGDPAAARLHGWSADGPVAKDGPYSERDEHLAGLFLIEVADAARAEAVAARFASPGETVELRPVA